MFFSYICLMICFPNAKINLGLHVLEKRGDGFHDIETIMYPVPLHDVIEFKAGTQDRLCLYGLPVPGNPAQNILLKTVKLIREHKEVPPLEIHLLKAIPMGSGLGGGSADAAFLIKALNQHFFLDFSMQDMKEIAQEVGSDCPFFIENKAALALGRGEVLKPLDFSLDGLQLVLVFPDIHIHTAWAYAHVVPHKPSSPLSDMIRQPMESWCDVMVNDFEPAVFANYPGLKAIKDTLVEMGALYASMTGSGAVVFGLFGPTRFTGDALLGNKVWVVDL